MAAAACDPVSRERREDSPGLGAREIYDDPVMNYPYGVALCQLEVDPATGGSTCCATTSPTRRAAPSTRCCSRARSSGGAIQGLGGALLEELTLRRGRPAEVDLVHGLPAARRLGHADEFDHLICEDAPTPTNPLGAKGAGESGIMAVGAAVAGAVSDALGDPAAITRLPLTPERVRSLIETTQPTHDEETVTA